MDRIQKAQRWLLGAEKLLLTVFILAMALLSFLQVILRAAFSSGLLWADTFLRYLVLWVGFLGAGLAAAEDKQFCLDAAQRILPERIKTLARIAVHAFTAGVCALLTQASARVLGVEYDAGRVLFSVGNLRLPAWILEVILPAGFLLLLLHYALKLAEAVLELKK